MSKIKYTKTELKTQKDALEMFNRYLPTLTLKKQQLQTEILKVAHAMEELEQKISGHNASLGKWNAVFAEEVHIEKMLSAEKVNTTEENVAGIDMPVFASIDFREEEYDLIKMPLWVDYGITALKESIELKVKHEIFERQLALLREELRITTQRVNLFEKVKIPEAKDNIRRINIVLGDMQTAAVVTGKISKNKIEKKHEIGLKQ